MTPSDISCPESLHPVIASYAFNLTAASSCPSASLRSSVGNWSIVRIPSETPREAIDTQDGNVSSSSEPVVEASEDKRV